ncbi:hypothetical protein Tco_0267852 [Tanacetum coccineum]
MVAIGRKRSKSVENGRNQSKTKEIGRKRTKLVENGGGYGLLKAVVVEVASWKIMLEKKSFDNTPQATIVKEYSIASFHKPSFLQRCFASISNANKMRTISTSGLRFRPTSLAGRTSVQSEQQFQPANNFNNGLSGTPGFGSPYEDLLLHRKHHIRPFMLKPHMLFPDNDTLQEDRLEYGYGAPLTFTEKTQTYEVHHHLAAPSTTATSTVDPLHDTNDSLVSMWIFMRPSLPKTCGELLMLILPPWSGWEPFEKISSMDNKDAGITTTRQ